MTGPEHEAASPEVTPESKPAPKPATTTGAAAAGSAKAGAPTAPAMALNLSSAETLIVSGALLMLVLGELILGALLGGGGVTIAGALAGVVLLVTLLRRSPTGEGSNDPIFVAGLVVIIVVLEAGDILRIPRNLSEFTGQGVLAILVELCEWVGAALMGLGVWAQWHPMPEAAKDAAGGSATAAK